MARLLIVSNRLPVDVTLTGGELAMSRNTSGLATGLRGPHERSGGLWIGWPGDIQASDAQQRTQVERELAARQLVPVWLSPEDAQRYDAFASTVLWPLFHYMADQLPLHVHDWDAYQRVNERVAEIVAAHHQPGDLVWIHDYHLSLVPRLLRRLLPEARIGFFLHVPFPASDAYRALPFRERLLKGLLGADLIGFHTASYMRHFVSSLLRMLGLAADIDRVRVGQREVRLGAFPMGIDTLRFTSLAADAEVADRVRALRGADGCAVLVAIDRLDYTKDIARRLLAFEQLLRSHPDLRERVQLVQIAIPSRTSVPAYRDFRAHVDDAVERLNGAFGTSRWTPVHYAHRTLSDRERVALYHAADVMLATPVRDGMNLVAKEFVASRVDEGGVLVLSEFAGAASELGGALHVNPYDVDRVARVYHQALTMPEDERVTRMRALRLRVLKYDVHQWAHAFIDALEKASTHPPPSVLTATPTDELEGLARRLRNAPHLLLLLDYDGTLVPFASMPDLATPDPSLIELLRSLAARPGTTVHIVTGRTKDSIERWLGDLPIGLHAEHGLWSRPIGGTWVSRVVPASNWRERVLPILEHVTARTPGSLIEEKTKSLSWHYRMVDPEFGARQANELRLHLGELLAHLPVEILTGNKVIEIRPRDIDKGGIVAALVAQMPADTMVAAIGDDETDEDLFAALPPGAVAIHVGTASSRAGIRVEGTDAVRRLLLALVREDG